MNDPHVNSLSYRLTPPENVTYNAPPPVTITRPGFHGTLADGMFTATMDTHYATLDEARAVVDPFLRGWEMTSVLQGGDAITFHYQDADIIDWSPSPPGGRVLHAVTAACTVSVSDAIQISICRAAYPAALQAFAATTTVQILWDRYCQWLQGRESLFSLANFSDTYLRWAVSDALGDTRRDASKAFHIDKAILKKIGDLAANRGGDREGRKAGTIPATPGERQWMTAAVRAIILQVGAVESGQAVTNLTMADLPPLE